ncbi:MAG: CBS domain-containing protein [bacterium]
MIIKNFITYNPIVISPSTTFLEIVNKFFEYHFDILPVVNTKHHLIGVISKADLIKIFIPKYFDLLDDLSFVKDFGALEIDEKHIELIKNLFIAHDLMTINVITVEEETTLLKAITLMVKNHIRCLPVLKEKKLIGVISKKDILKIFFNKENIQKRENIL